MALILCLETATDICSVALIDQGRQALSVKASGEAFDQASRLTLLIEACLNDSPYQLQDVDAVAVSIGPGSYTSLRIGLSTAKGISYALDKPLIAINTLKSLAVGTAKTEGYPTALFCPMIDARRMEVFTGIFDAQGNTILPPVAMILAADSFQEYFEKGIHLIFSGNGAAKFQSLVSTSLAGFSSALPTAVHLGELAEAAFLQGQFEDIAYCEPFYLKPPNITIPRPLL